MATNRNLVTTESRGWGKYENRFDGSSVITDLDHIALTRIVVWHELFINSLTMYYSGTEAAVTMAGAHGTRAEAVLEPGEFITTIEGVVHSAVIGQLTFLTNRGTRFGPYGSPGALSKPEPFIWNATDIVSTDLAPPMGLLYFSGHADCYVRRLCATFALYPSGARSKREIIYETRDSGTLNTSSVALSNFARSLMSPTVALLVGTDKVVFHAYEATLCRVPFFHAALQGEFREATEKKITLPEDVPEIFSALLEHLYTGKYTYTYDPDATTVLHDTPVFNLSEGYFHVRVYAVAFKYGWQPLVEHTVRIFLFILPKLTGIDIVHLWKAAYENGWTMSVCSGDGRLANFQKLLPALLRGLYETDCPELESTIADLPSLASDIIRLLLAAGRV